MALATTQELLLDLQPLLERVAERLGSAFQSEVIPIPGIGTGSAYAAGDAFWGKFQIGVPKRGTIITAIMVDPDDEGIATEVYLSQADFTATADNSAFTFSDTAEAYTTEGYLLFDVWKDYGSVRVSEASNVPKQYWAPTGRLYCQCVTRGAPNIAAGKIPRVMLRILADTEAT